MTAKKLPTRLVADIGGTNARFALARRDADGALDLSAIDELQTADFESLADAARHYLDDHQASAIDGAVFAVASPVTGDAIKITNNPWKFSIAALQKDLKLKALELINDFAAVGYAVPELQRDDVQAVGCTVERLASESRDGHYSVLGPGTGLGVARLILRDGESIVLGTEGGHVSFAATTPDEVQILEALWHEHPRVSAERLLSGPGLVNLYRAVCEVAGQKAKDIDPADVTEHAKKSPDGLEARSVDLFCAVLGAFAGDAALMQGGWDGVYLAGGITQKLLPWIQRSAFREHFESKGRFRELLKKVPTIAIVHPQVGLLGSAARALA